MNASTSGRASLRLDQLFPTGQKRYFFCICLPYGWVSWPRIVAFVLFVLCLGSKPSQFPNF